MKSSSLPSKSLLSRRTLIWIKAKVAKHASIFQVSMCHWLILRLRVTLLSILKCLKILGFKSPPRAFFALFSSTSEVTSEGDLLLSSFA